MIRSLERATSELNRASDSRRCRSSVSAALSSASDTLVASDSRALRWLAVSGTGPSTTSSPRGSPRTVSGSSSEYRVSGSPAIARAASSDDENSRASYAGPVSCCAACSVAVPISSRPAAATSARPASRSARSRCTDRSSWRTMPAIRATTSRNSAAEAPIMTKLSMSAVRACSTVSAIGAISDAAVSTIRRVLESLDSFSGADSSSVRIDGCSAAAPHSR